MHGQPEGVGSLGHLHALVGEEDQDADGLLRLLTVGLLSVARA